jgi:hypothetical protein
MTVVQIGNDDDIEALKEDVASECGQFGTVVNTVVPKLGVRPCRFACFSLPL